MWFYSSNLDMSISWGIVNKFQTKTTNLSESTFSHGRCAVLDLKQQLHDLSFFCFFGWERFFININQQFVEILDVIRFQEWQVATWLVSDCCVNENKYILLLFLRYSMVTCLYHCVFEIKSQWILSKTPLSHHFTIIDLIYLARTTVLLINVA